ncbi:MAG: hypothetical protein KF862_27115 [Chitinophagaceae bacterium]|nr:hypothetical protein [Chitinophagaceae bacterium]
MTTSKKYFSLVIVVTLLCLGFQFCKKQTDSFTIDSYKEYYPLEVGKYIIYRLDSTVFVNFDTEKEIHSYQVKDMVDAEITDAAGQQAYRIRRMIRNLDGTGEWKDNATFMVTPLNRSLEVVEDNLRYIKLTNPVKENYYWEGNSYIQAIEDLSYLQYWEYNYQNVAQPYIVNDNTFENTITVQQIDESSGDPELYPNSFASKDYSTEVYAKNTGLIYKEFIHWTYQRHIVVERCRIKFTSSPDSVQCPPDVVCTTLADSMNGYVRCDTVRNSFSYSGYGIKLTAIEHN